MPLVALGDRDDEPEVRVDHPLLRLEVAALDPLRQLDLLGRGQQRIAADLVEEELEAVGRRGRELAVRVCRLAGAVAAAVVGDLDAASLEQLVHLLDGVLVDLALRERGLELRERHAAVLLPLLDEDEQVVGQLHARVRGAAHLGSRFGSMLSG